MTATLHTIFHLVLAVLAVFLAANILFAAVLVVSGWLERRDEE